MQDARIRGFETGEIAVEVRGDKIVFAPRTAGDAKHFTLHFGLGSGIVDLHETSEGTGDAARRTLYAAEREELQARLPEFKALLEQLYGLIRPLRRGWMKHQNIEPVWGLYPVTDPQIEAVSRKRKRRLAFDREKWEDSVQAFLHLDEVLDFPDGAFALYHRNRQIGIGFKVTDGSGNAHLHWIKLKDFRGLIHRWKAIFENVLLEIAIPREDYPKYRFLRP